MANNKNIAPKRPFNHNEKKVFFNSGIDIDSSKQISGGDSESDSNGKYLKGKNNRINSVDGNTLSQEKIGGETLVYDNSILNNTYKCVYSTEVNSKLFEIWADEKEILNSLITIDGKIVLDSDKFPAKHYYPFDGAVNQNKLGGEIFITDNNSVPMYFYIDELLNPNPVNKFTTGFNLDVHTVNQKVPLNIPVFDDLVDVGFGGGLPAGQYSYSIRYSSKDGDKTNWSVPTPNILVPRRYVWRDKQEAVYPYIKTIGSDPDIENPTSYGIKIKFRVDNVYNYDYIEIKRVSYNAGEGLGFRPNEYIVKKIAIKQNQLSVEYYVDGYYFQDQEITVPLDDTQNNLSIIQRAKTVRYIENKVVFMNISYFNKIVNKEDLSYIKHNGKTSFYPIIKDLGEQGLKSIDNNVNFKPLMNDEEYGWGLVCYDSNFQSSYVTPIDDFKSFKMPSRRDAISDSRSIAQSENPTNCANVNGVITDTFECVDYSKMRRKLTLDEASEKEYPSNDKNKKVMINIAHTDATVGTPPNDLDSGTGTGYKPLRPMSQSDSSDTYDYSLVDKAYVKTGSEAIENANKIDYTPHGFAPRYKSLGMCLDGVDRLPSWATSFSIVRTKAAGRVICQGLGFYSIIGGRFKSPGHLNNRSWSKKKNALICQFPDIENSAISSKVVQDMILNPLGYEVQLVAPYGFFTEPYHFNSNDDNALVEKHNQFDMVSYVRVQEERLGYEINPYPNFASVGKVDAINGRGCVRYGKWLNPNANTNPFTGGDFGNTTFSISSVKEVSEKGNYRNIEIIFNRNIYDHDLEQVRGDIDQTKVQNLLEPVYIINIIKKGVSVQDKQFQEYKYTGNFIKVKSVIGYGNGLLNQKLEIVDERLEDYHTTDSQDRFIYIDEDLNGVFKKWINVNGKTAPQIAVINNQISLGIYGGKYTSSKGFIQFNSNIPRVNSVIEVRYDNRFPIKIFGGDTSVGESTMVYYNRIAGGQGGGSSEDHVFFNQGFPYRKWEFNRRYYINKKASPVTRAGAIQDINKACISNVRNFAIVYTCQSKTHLPMAYGDFFPNTHYVVRPIEWKLDSGNGNNVSNTPIGLVGLNRDNVIFQGYYDDRPDEWKKWNYGGIKGSIFPINLDYSKECEHFKLFSKPSVGFEEKKDYYNRIIWSQTRPISSYNQPSLKTFRPYNYKDIEDTFGEIEKSWSASSQNGYNLYALCRDNICLILIRKNILLDSNGNGLASSKTSDDTFIPQTIWVGDTSLKALQSNGRFSFVENGDSCYFVNRISVFKFTNNQQIDIVSGNKTTIYNNLLRYLSKDEIQDTSGGTDICGVFDKKHNELWIQAHCTPELITYNNDLFDKRIDCENIEFNSIRCLYGISGLLNLTLSNPNKDFTLYISPTIEVINTYLQIKNHLGVLIVNAISNSPIQLNYSKDTDSWTYSYITKSFLKNKFTTLYVYQDNGGDKGYWISEFDYRFDKYCCIDNIVYGSKNLKTYKLDNGFKINDENIVFELHDNFNTRDDEHSYGKQFVRIRVNSNNCPSKVLFYEEDNINDVVSSLDETQLKNRHGFENYIPRNIFNKNRIQGVDFSFKIVHDKEEKFIVNSATISYFMLK